MPRLASVSAEYRSLRALGHSILAVTVLAGLTCAQDVKQGPFGGAGGSAFDRIAPQGAHISSVMVRAGSNIDNLRLLYSDVKGAPAGDTGWIGTSTGGTLSTFTIPANDYLERVELWQGGVVDRIRLTTRAGLTATYGGFVSTLASMSLAGHEIIGFHGRVGNLVDALGVTLRPAWVARLGAFGGAGGTAFTHVAPAGTHISSVLVRAGSNIDNLRFTYVDSNLQPAGDTGWFGTSMGGTLSTFTVPGGDYLERIELWQGGAVDRIRLTTHAGVTATYGSFVSTYADMTIACHEIVGFFGGIGNLVDRLGVVLRPVGGVFAKYGLGCPGTGNLVPNHFGGATAPDVGKTISWSVDNARPNAIGALFIGTVRTNLSLAGLGMGTCVALTNMVTSLPISTNASGVGNLPVTVNVSYAFIGVHLVTQIALVDPGTATSLKVVTSNGLDTRIGGTR